MGIITLLRPPTQGLLRKAGRLGVALLLAGLALGGLLPATASAFSGDAPSSGLAGAPTPAVGSGIVARPLTSGSLEDGHNSAVTAPVTIGANKLALLWVAQSDGTGGLPTLTDSHRQWEVVTTTFATLQRLTLYRSMKHTGTSGSIAITPSDPTSVAWTLVEYGNVDATGHNGAGAVAQFEATNFKNSGVGMTTYASTVLSQTSRKGSASVGGFAVQKNAQALTPGKGYSFTGSKACGAVCAQAEFRGKFTRLVDLSWRNESPWLVVAVELKRQS